MLIVKCEPITFQQHRQLNSQEEWEDPSRREPGDGENILERESSICVGSRVCMLTCACAHAYMREREKERDFVSLTKEVELFPKGHGKSWTDFRQMSEMIGFVRVKCGSGGSVENGLESGEGCVGISQVRSSGQDGRATVGTLPM